MWHISTQSIANDRLNADYEVVDVVFAKSAERSSVFTGKLHDFASRCVVYFFYFYFWFESATSRCDSHLAKQAARPVVYFSLYLALSLAPFARAPSCLLQVASRAVKQAPAQVLVRAKVGVEGLHTSFVRWTTERTWHVVETLHSPSHESMFGANICCFS
jgi:hypothetical protein